MVKSMGKIFVEVFPPELSNILFSYLSERELFLASQCCLLWRNTINNDQQWVNRCLQKGWTTKLTLNEPHLWKDLSYVDTPSRGRLRKTPEFSLGLMTFSSEDSNDELDPLCDWAIYYRQRLHTLRNWKKGNYVIHELISCGAEADTLIISDSDYNGKYLVIGTTTGYVFIWNVIGIPQILQTIKPALLNKEVIKVALTSNGNLIVLYEGAIVHVYEEKDCGTGQITFELKALAKIFLKSDNQNQLPKLQAEVWTKTDLTLLVSNYNDGELDSKKYWSIFATRTETEIPLIEDILLSVSGETILISSESGSSYILWNLNDDQDYQIQGLPDTYKITQLLTDCPLLFFAIEHEEYSTMRINYGIVIYETTEFKDCTKITLSTEAKVPTCIDEMIYDQDQSSNQRRLAICSHDGLVGAYCITSKSWIFLNETGQPVDNLATCKELILYQECTNYDIVALSWLGTFLYKITGHIGPIRRIRCIDQFIVSGGAARELMIWDKHSGQRVSRVYRQPSRIVNLFASSSSIITVGKDDSPVLIGYL